MTQAHYTFRVQITSKEGVRVDVYDAENNDKGHPSGSFGFRGKVRTRILKLHQAAQRGEVTETEIQELGEKLFEILLDQGLRARFFMFRDEARQKNVALRFELDIDERQLPEIAALPWEFMRVKPAMEYGVSWIGTDPHVISSRHRPPPLPPQPIQLAPGERLRIALAVAAPGDLRKVKYELIWEELQNWEREQRGRIELLGIVNPANRQKINEILERRPHILHFIGHGRVKDESGHDVRQVALVDASFNVAEWLDADKFVELFNQHQPGVVLLQTCEGATSSGTDIFVGIASFVVQQNIPVVVAMQYEISNATAQTFALEFYKKLAKNEPVDMAAQEGRRRIALGPTSYASRDFATPVLFMRVKDGRLFLSSPGTSEETSEQAEEEGEETGMGVETSSDTMWENMLELLEEISDRFSSGGMIYREECEMFDALLD